MATLLDALNQIGADNTSVQMIEIGSCVVSFKDNKRTKDTEITIATTEVSSDDLATGSGKVGVVVWVDRDDWSNAVKGLIGAKE